MAPAETELGPVMVATMSACGMTEVTTWAAAAEPSLLAALGSLVSAVLKTELLKVPLAGAVAMTVKFAATPLPRLARDQVTTPALYVPPLEAETNVAPVGSVWLT